MSENITRKRTVIDTAEWVAGDTGQIVEAVKLSDLGAVPLDDLADAAHMANGAMEARDVATAHVRELEGQLLTAQNVADEHRANREILARDIIDLAENREPDTHNANVVYTMLRDLRKRATEAERDLQCARENQSRSIEQLAAAEKRASEAEARVVSAAHEASTLRTRIHNQATQIDVARSEVTALRSKLADAERVAESATANVGKYQDALTRYAALERAAREWRYNRGADAALMAAVDALTPAPTPSPAPATCGECKHMDREQRVKGWNDCLNTDESSITATHPTTVACPAFTRRLPVVADTRPAAQEVSR